MKHLLLTLLILLSCAPNVPAHADQPLRLAIVGLTHDHVRGYLPEAKKRSDIELVGVVESNAELARRYAEQNQLPSQILFSNLDELLTNSKPEAVAIFSDTFDHLRIVQACAAKGVHVMMEKPLAVSMEHARGMQAAAKSGGIHVIVNYETTWYSSNRAAFEMAHDEHKLGLIRKMVVHDGHSGPKKIGCSQEFLHWLTDPKLNGAGALTDFGCYGADLMTWLMDGTRPTSVFAVTQQLQPSLYPKVDDEATIVITYPNAQGIIQASWNWPRNRKDMEIYGESGAIFALDRTRMQIRMGNSPPTEEVAKPIAAPQQDALTYFRSIVRGETKPDGLSSLETNLIVTEILDAARESAATGKRVLLPPQQSDSVKTP